MRNCTMQRRHFALIAETIKNLNVSQDVRRHVSEEFRRALRATNSNFDSDKFLTACEPEPEATETPSDFRKQVAADAKAW
jgi:hypothetical protein